MSVPAASPNRHVRFPVGIPGTPWGAVERAQWLTLQRKHRDYFTEVVSPLMRLGPASHVDILCYGQLEYREFGSARFPLFAAKSVPWKAELPMVAVTGGVHGYETSGIHGALLFIQHFLVEEAAKGVNVLVLPCVSPWGYEMTHRWTPKAVDPNRQFNPANPGCDEAALAMRCIEDHRLASAALLLHIDLHETTDTDNSVFTPSKFARDGLTEDKYDKWYPIPDGFYVFGDNSRERPQDEFSQHIIAAVEKVTHIAEADADGCIVGERIAHRGVLLAPGAGTADAHSTARYVTTTEVYPDSPQTTPEQCNRAQATAVRAAIQYVLCH